MSLTISNAYYNSFLTETYISTANAEGLRQFIGKSTADKETEIKAWATSKKSTLESNQTNFAATAASQDAAFTAQIADMTAIINS